MRWSAEDVEWLNKNYMKSSVTQRKLRFPNRSEASIQSKAWQLGLRPTNGIKNTYDASKLSTDTNVGCYWGGFLAADGSVTASRGREYLVLELSRKDRSHVEKFSEFMQYAGPVLDYDRPAIQSSKVMLRVNPELKSALNSFNIVPRKSLIYQPPIISDPYKFLSFMVGYIDGDGSIYTAKGSPVLNIVGTLYTLTIFKKFIEHQFGEHRGECIYKRTGNYYTYSVDRVKLRQIWSYVEDLNLPLLERKWGPLR